MAAKKKQEEKEIKSRKPGPETKKKVAGAAANTSLPKAQSAEALQKSEDRYRTLVEKAFEGIIVIRDGEIVFANPRAYEMIGYPRDQVAPRAFMDFIHPDDVEILTGNYLRRLKGEQFEETYTIRLVDRQGNIKWAQISTSLINWEGKPATLTFLTDITERNRVEKALLFTRFSLDNAADTMVCVDREAHFIDVNDTFCRACGYSREELLSMKVHDLDPDYSAEIWPEFWEKLKKSGSLIFETYHRSKEGELYPVEISARYFEHDGKEYHTAVARDITERKKSEEALEASEAKYRLLADN
ncbi:MAG: PAS domain S-box protein, partial [Chloroflexi bacterium]|nr:PAS domain S-box protein [Chloroflexota bacterium]